MSKRKADKLSSSDGPSEPFSCCPAPGYLFGYGPAAQGSKGELAAERSRQLGPTEGGLAYVVVIAKCVGCTSLQQPIGLQKSLVRVCITLNLLLHPRRTLGTRLSETCPGICGMLDGITSNAQVAKNSVARTVEQ